MSDKIYITPPMQRALQVIYERVDALAGAIHFQIAEANLKNDYSADLQKMEDFIRHLHQAASAPDIAYTQEEVQTKFAALSEKELRMLHLKMGADAVAVNAKRAEDDPKKLAVNAKNLGSVEKLAHHPIMSQLRTVCGHYVEMALEILGFARETDDSGTHTIRPIRVANLDDKA